MSSELYYLPATTALEMFRARTLSPVELLEAQIRRTGELNPKINAVVEEFFDEARVTAGSAEQAYQRGDARALEGLTVGVKDEHNIEGRKLPNGSLLFADFVSTYTDPICERVLEAGAIIHAR